MASPNAVEEPKKEEESLKVEEKNNLDTVSLLNILIALCKKLTSGH